MKITYDWLLANGFVRMERLERQPCDHVQRAIGTETIGEHFLQAAEDLCISMAPTNDKMEEWYCWIARATVQHRHPSVWVHVRHLHLTEEVELLYEGLTGRTFSAGMKWLAGNGRSPIGAPVFPEVAKSLRCLKRETWPVDDKKLTASAAAVVRECAAICERRAESHGDDLRVRCEAQKCADQIRHNMLGPQPVEADCQYCGRHPNYCDCESSGVKA